MTKDNGNLSQSLVKAQENKISLTKSQEIYQDYFNEISKLEDDDVIVKAGCKFCVHPARSEAELKWEKTNSCSVVMKFFEKYREQHPESPRMYWQNVKNHLLNHYEQQQKKVWLREYSDRLISVMNKRISDEQRLDMLTRQMEMQFHDIAADPRLDPLKRADAMAKLSKMIVDLTMTQAKLRGDLQSVTLVTEKFTNVWFKTIAEQKDPQAKRALIESLDSFQEHLEGVPIVEPEN